MRKQRLEGRIVTQKAETERHNKLTMQIESIIERARDSTLMETEYDARLIEEFFKCKPIEITLPANEWEKLPQQGNNPDRKFAVGLYRDRVKRSLEMQGLVVVMALEMK